MKLQVLLMLALLCLSHSCSKTNENDLKKENLNGPVKSYIQTYYGLKVEDGKALINDTIQRIYRLFNEEGNIIEYHDTQRNSSWQYYTATSTYSYDNKGRLHRYVTLNPQYDSEEEVITYYKLNNKKDKEIHFYNEVKGSTYTYDYHDSTIVETQISADGIMLSKTIISDNKNGKGRKVEIFDSKGELIKWQIEERNSDKLITKKIEHSITGRYTNQKEYNYDNYGNPIQYIYHTISLSSDNGPSRLDYQYKFDEHGNWIKKLIFEKSVPIEFLTREIEYFTDKSSISEKPDQVDKKQNSGIDQTATNKEELELDLQNVMPFKELLISEGLGQDIPQKGKYEELEAGLYQNYYYQISVNFPIDYQFDRGKASHTVIRAYNPNKGISIILNVIPITKDATPSVVTTEFQKAPLNYMNSICEGGYANYMRSKLSQESRDSIYDFKVEDQSFNGLGFVGYSFSSKSDSEPVAYQWYSCTTYIKGVMILIGYSAPDFYAEKKVFDQVLESVKIHDLNE